jgi:RND family efflux transporter MFP subunit
MKKIFVTIVVLAFIAVLGWEVYSRIGELRGPTARDRKAPPVAVEAEPARKDTVRDIGFFTGTLHPYSQFIVAPKIAGRLEKLFVKIGDPVKKGQLIAVLEDDEYLQQVDQARAELQVAKANVEEGLSALDTARRELERAKALRQKKIASESELDAASAEFAAQEAKYKVALAQVAQKEAALRAAHVRLSYTKIRATWEEGDQDRVVGERFVDEGTMLAPNTPIASILDICSLTGVIFVIERDYSKVKVGQEALISTDAFPDRTFSGKVVRMAPLIKETSREARVEVDIRNPEGLLKPGMFIRAQIEFSKVDNATVIPARALTKRGGRQGVFVINSEEMTAQFVPLKLGIASSEWVQVIEPPLSGSVVTLGHHMLEDGSAIVLPGEGAMGQDGDRKKDQRKGGEG